MCFPFMLIILQNTFSRHSMLTRLVTKLIKRILTELWAFTSRNPTPQARHFGCLGESNKCLRSASSFAKIRWHVGAAQVSSECLEEAWSTSAARVGKSRVHDQQKWCAFLESFMCRWRASKDANSRPLQDWQMTAMLGLSEQLVQQTGLVASER